MTTHTLSAMAGHLVNCYDHAVTVTTKGQLRQASFSEIILSDCCVLWNVNVLCRQKELHHFFAEKLGAVTCRGTCV